jgi:hypothetical protein
VTEAAVSQCEITMSAKADTSPEATRRMVAAFEAFGVTKEQIEQRIQRRIDAIQPAQVVSLKKIYASLRDGMSRPADWFEQPEEVAKETLKDKLKAKSAKDKGGQTPETDGETARAGEEG